MRELTPQGTILVDTLRQFKSMAEPLLRPFWTTSYTFSRKAYVPYSKQVFDLRNESKLR